MSFRAVAFSAVFLTGLTGLTGCEGCKTPSSKSADGGTDAASSTSSATAAVLDAGPDAAPRDSALVVVAEGSSDGKLVRTLDNRIVLLSGSMPFEAKPNGALEPLVTGAALAPLYPDDDTLVGFLESSTSVQWVRGDLGSPGPLFVDGFAGLHRKTFTVRDRKLVAATTPIEAQFVVRWKGKLLGASFGQKQNEMAWLEDKSEPAPPPVAKIPNITSVAVDAQGTLVVLGFNSYESPRAALFPSTWKAGEPPTVVEAGKWPECSLVPSFDASVVLRCALGSPGYGDGTKFFRIAAAGFDRVYPDAPSSVSGASIAKDGTLYVVSPKKLAVERCPTPAGKCTAVEVKTDFTPVETAQYEPNVSDVVERKGEFDMGDRAWTTIKVEYNPTKDAIGGSASILARDENDIWIFTRNYRRAVVFHRAEDPQRERTRLPSQLDGRIMAKNANPPQAWTGHCEQVFVRLSAGDAKRSADIQKALGTKPLEYDGPFHYWVVEGRLHEDKVSGVVIVRRDVEEKLEKMERATEKLVDAFTPDPMSKPKVYCTLPVLERVLYPGKP